MMTVAFSCKVFQFQSWYQSQLRSTHFEFLQLSKFYTNGDKLEEIKIPLDVPCYTFLSWLNLVVVM